MRRVELETLIRGNIVWVKERSNFKVIKKTFMLINIKKRTEQISTKHVVV